MSPAWARCVDDACVELLEATSWRSPRDVLRDCRGCGMPFWARAPSRGSERLYCAPACLARAYYRAHPGYRARKIERQRVRRAA